MNLTDEDSRIMPVAGGGFDQCYNVQARVATGSLLGVASEVSQAPNDKQQLEPMLTKLNTLSETLGQVETLLADSGYCSEANVDRCEAAGMEPLIGMRRAVSDDTVRRALRDMDEDAGVGWLESALQRCYRRFGHYRRMALI